MGCSLSSADGRLMFFSVNGFTDTPLAYREQVPVAETNPPVLNFTVPEGLVAQYTLLAIFNKPGAGIDDLKQSLRSNIAQTSIDFILE